MWFDILKKYSYEWKGSEDGRPIMLVDVKGEKVLFYIRTGGGGPDNKGVPEKDQIKAGQFAPFFGFRKGWFIKPIGSRGGKYLTTARWLDANVPEEEKTASYPTPESQNKFNRQMEKEGVILTNGKDVAQTKYVYGIKVHGAFEMQGILRWISAIRERMNLESQEMDEFEKEFSELKRAFTTEKKSDVDEFERTLDEFNDEWSVYKDKFERAQDEYDIDNDVELTHTVEVF